MATNFYDLNSNLPKVLKIALWGNLIKVCFYKSTHKQVGIIMFRNNYYTNSKKNWFNFTWLSKNKIK